MCLRYLTTATNTIIFQSVFVKMAPQDEALFADDECFERVNRDMILDQSRFPTEGVWEAVIRYNNAQSSERSGALR